MTPTRAKRSHPERAEIRRIFWGDARGGQQSARSKVIALTTCTPMCGTLAQSSRTSSDAVQPRAVGDALTGEMRRVCGGWHGLRACIHGGSLDDIGDPLPWRIHEKTTGKRRQYFGSLVIFLTRELGYERSAAPYRRDIHPTPVSVQPSRRRLQECLDETLTVHGLNLPQALLCRGLSSPFLSSHVANRRSRCTTAWWRSRQRRWRVPESLPDAWTSRRLGVRSLARIRVLDSYGGADRGGQRQDSCCIDAVSRRAKRFFSEQRWNRPAAEG